MYTGLANLGLSGYHNQYSELKEQAILAARRNNASLWFAGAPSDLAGFVWQDSAGTVPATGTDPIGRLTDRAGSNAATQSTAANKPTLELQANGYFGMRFDGTDFLAFVSSPITSFAQDCNIIAVVRVPTATALARAAIQIGNSADVNPILELSLTPALQPRIVVRDSAGISTTLVDPTSPAVGSCVVIRGQKIGTQYTLFVNGSQVGQGTIVTPATSFNTGTLGARQTGGGAVNTYLDSVFLGGCLMPTNDAAGAVEIENFFKLLGGVA